jgi:hypothetical protein
MASMSLAILTSPLPMNSAPASSSRTGVEFTNGDEPGVKLRNKGKRK